MKTAIFAVILAVARGSVVSPIAPISPITTYAVPLAISSQYHAQDTIGQYNYGYVSPLSSKAELKTVDGITRGAYNYVDAEGRLQSVQYTSDSVNGFRVAASNLPVAPEVPQVEPLPQPTPVQDTPEVAAAKAKHLAALEEAKIRAEAPAPVVTTTSVVSSAPVVSSAQLLTTAPAIQTYAYGISSPLISTYAYPNIATYAAPWVGAPSYFLNSVAAPVAPADTPEVAAARVQHLAAVEEVKARN